VYRVDYTRSALKSLRRMPRNIAGTIRTKIIALADDPYAPHNNAAKLQGRDGYRLRVGDWRVLYDLDAAHQRLLVLDVKPRGGAYP
jgi:mRNA interferase RelE/StbE